MEGGKCHAKAGQNVWICYEGCKNANALHQAIPLPHQCLLIKGLRQCTLVPPTVMNDCRLFGNSQRIYVANPHLSRHAATRLLDAPRRTRLLSVSSTRPSLKKTTGPNNSDCSTQKFSWGCASMWQPGQAFRVCQPVMCYWWFVFAGRCSVQLFHTQIIGHMHISPVATESTVR